MSNYQEQFRRIKNGWVKSTWLVWIIIAIAASLFIGILLNYLLSVSLWFIIPLLVISTVVLIYIDRSWRIDLNDITAYLDKSFPQLQESSRLLIQPQEELAPLKQIQAGKTKAVLETLDIPAVYNPKLKTAILSLFISGLMVLLVLLLPPLEKQQSVTYPLEAINKKNAEIILPVLQQISVKITPPAYTRLPSELQEGGAVKALAGSALHWEIHFTAAVAGLTMTINDVKQVHATSTTNSSVWTIDMNMPGQGFYQIRSGGYTSPLYQLEQITDKAPEIRVHSPIPDLLIKYGQPETVRLGVSIKDDYGISHGYISATVSRGSGEAVKFEQRKIPLNQSFINRARDYNIAQMLDLKKMNMIPGDELYLFVGATDIHQQESRSDIFRVILEDTTELFSMEGLNSGIDIKPEFFRSQRQIIIETEQLLRDASHLTPEKFKEKSNNLGIDQKLLRLRYGKFLGEESSTYSQEGEEAGHDDHEKPVSPNKPADVLSEFGHSHDNAEDATYFDAETKKQLRATLNEMWKSELQLRTFKPKDALPFEYEALRLLKDLQQKSRVYVAKTNMRTTPLKPESRYTGDLSEIVQPVYNTHIEFKPHADEPIGEALGLISDLTAGRPFSTADLEVFRKAHQELTKKTTDEPASYLPSLKAMRNVLAAMEKKDALQRSELILISGAFQQILSTRDPAPEKNLTLVHHFPKPIFSN